METILAQELISEGNIPHYEVARPYTVFVVEDSDIYRMFLVRSLNRLTNSNLENKPNCIIHSFASGEECIEHLWKKPDIVILDYFLNGDNPSAMDGLDLVKKIKHASPSTEILVLSEQTDVQITAELFNQGVSSYIPKEPQGQNRIQNSVLNSIKRIETARKRERARAILAIVVFLLGVCVVMAL